MGTRVRSWMVVCIVLAGLAGGCGGTPTGHSGFVRRGQTGDYVTVEFARSASPDAPVPPSLPHHVFLDEFFETTGFSRSAMPHTPIVVTEDPSDEEFWEFTILGTGAKVEDFDRPWFVVGTRPQCEALRAQHVRDRRATATGPCIGPHYFKRTGPAVLLKPAPYTVDVWWSNLVYRRPKR